MGRNWWVLPLLLAVMIIGLLRPGEVEAQSPNVAFDPLLLERSVRSGDSLSYTISIQNEDRFDPITLEAVACDIAEDINGTYHLVPAGTNQFSLADWIAIEPQVVTIPPASERAVNVTIKVPRGVSGGRYGAVALSPKESAAYSPGEAAQAPFKFRMASFIELQIVGGTTRKEAFISNASVLPSSEVPVVRQRVGDGAIVYTAELTNVGNIHVIARGSLLIQTEEGRTVARYPMGGGRGLILPEGTVALRSVTGPNLPPGKYRAKTIIDYGGRRPAVADIAFVVTESRVEGKAEDARPLSRLVVEPDELEVKARAGSFSSSIIELANRGEEPIEINSRILPLVFSIRGEFLPEEERGEAPEWVQLSPADFTIEPGRTKRVRLSMRPPKDADGGYYYDIIFRSTSEEATIESGANVLLFVGSEVIKKGQLGITSIKREEEVAIVDALFTNEGNYHLHMSAEFVLRRVFPQYEEEETGRIVPRQTETIALISLPMDTSPILPGTSRVLSFQIPAALELGEYEMAIRADYGGEEPAITGLIFSIEGSNGADG
ncbi:MAG: DUF916 domain-containing protein [Firmicutes bacterium]|nr:DUF916 domain-containing protein [Bacillota bacterium]